MSDRPRAIVHLDLDAFFAAVEVLERPELADKPLLIGGRPGTRGVVATASYEARVFGVHSAMPMTRAVALCPDAIIVPPRHRVYQGYSQQVMETLRQLSPAVQQTSIDEAVVDLTDQIDDWDGAVEAARRIQSRIKVEVGLSASLGVATNKLVAKVASDRDKPGGLTVVPPGKEATFLAPLPVRVLWGVGPVTATKLAEIGITKVGELARQSEDLMRARFGRHGGEMVRRAQGIDRRPVVVDREVKSVSHETTFSRDLYDAEDLRRHLLRLSQRVARRLERKEMAAGTVALKLRYGDFTTLTRQMTLAVPADDPQVIYSAALTLFQRVWRRGRGVRLLGVAGRHLSPRVGQLPLL
jgi:nucleotidyltransferase/DNA polymerase involved in DNA repair